MKWVCPTAIRFRKATAAAALAIFGLAVSGPGVQASLGTGIGASPIVLSTPAIPSHQYQLPSVYIVNTGTESSYYVVKVERFADDTGHAIPASWITFGRNDFQLAPKASAIVPITLSVPANAATGDYRSHLVAGTEAAPKGGGVALGAAAATRLMFTVAAASAPGFSIPWPWPWWGYVLAAAALVAIVVLVLRRLGFRLQVERR